MCYYFGPWVFDFSLGGTNLTAVLSETILSANLTKVYAACPIRNVPSSVVHTERVRMVYGRRVLVL